MAAATKKCRVCGKTYEVCLAALRNTGVFRWQEVACSPECGSIYLAAIENSRKPKKAKLKTAESVKLDIITLNGEDGEPDTDLDDRDNDLDDYFDGVDEE